MLVYWWSVLLLCVSVRVACIIKYTTVLCLICMCTARKKRINCFVVLFYLQMNASKTVLALEGHAEILQDTACQVQPMRVLFYNKVLRS